QPEPAALVRSDRSSSEHTRHGHKRCQTPPTFHHVYAFIKLWAPYGARSGRLSIEFASSSSTKRSAFASHVSGRPSFIAIQLTMQALLLRCPTGAGAIGCLRVRTASIQFA